MNSQEAWKQRCKFWAEGSKLCAEADKLVDEAANCFGKANFHAGGRLDAEAYKLYAESGVCDAEGAILYAEAGKLRAKGVKLQHGGNIIFFDAIIKEYGNVTATWVGDDLHLDNGVVFKEVE